MRKIALLATMMAAIPSAGFAQAPVINELHLVCLGAGSANKQHTSSAYFSASDGSSAWGNVVANRAVPFEDQVNIDILGGEGRVRMPRTMLPLLHGGDGGWFKLKNVKVTDNEITASAAVNPINNPKVRIDRLTGNLSMSGKAGDYNGECQPYDPSTAQRKF